MSADETPFDRWDEAVRLFVHVSARSGSQVAAIREVRERFGLDLVTAKEVAARAHGYRDLAAKQAELLPPLLAALDELEEEHPTDAATSYALPRRGRRTDMDTKNDDWTVAEWCAARRSCADRGSGCEASSCGTATACAA